MDREDLIAANEVCIHHKIEYSFINALSDYGLIEVTTVEQTTYISASQLQKLERYIRLHNDLDINVPGIEAITNLLERIENMQRHITSLKNRLSFYEVINGGVEEEA